MNIVNYSIENELIGSRKLINSRNKTRSYMGFKKNICDINTLINSDHFSRKLPPILKEKEFDLKNSNLNKIFCSQWIDERKVVMGTKCNKIVLLDTLTGKYSIQSPLKSHKKSMNIQNHCGIHSISINPSGTMLATGAENVNDLAVYSLPNMEPVSVGYGAHSYWIFDILWLDDEHICTGAGDSRLALWKVQNNMNSKQSERNSKVLNNQFFQKSSYYPSSSSRVSPSTSFLISSNKHEQTNDTHDSTKYIQPNRISLKRHFSSFSFETPYSTSSNVISTSTGTLPFYSMPLRSSSNPNTSNFYINNSTNQNNSNRFNFNFPNQNRFNFYNRFYQFNNNDSSFPLGVSTGRSSTNESENNIQQNEQEEEQNYEDMISSLDEEEDENDEEEEEDEIYNTWLTSVLANNSNSNNNIVSDIDEETEEEDDFNNNNNNFNYENDNDGNEDYDDFNKQNNEFNDDDEYDNHVSFKRQRLNSFGKFKPANSYKYSKPIKIVKCKQSKRIRALAFNPKRNEIAAISMNSAFHYFDIKRFEQKYTKKLSPLKENVCLTINDDYSIYAIGSASHVQLLDANNARQVIQPVFIKKDIGVRSVHFRNKILSIGTGIGTVLFYDLRAHKFLNNESDQDKLKLKTNGGWILKNETYYETLPYGYNTDYSHAIYTHSYDPSGTKLLAAGGPLTVNLYGHYVGVWR